MARSWTRATMAAEIASTAASALVYSTVRRVRSDILAILRPFAEEVSLAANGVDQPRAAARLELVPQARDVDVDDVARGVVAVVPDVTRDLRAIQRLAGAPHEQLEHRALACRERELPPRARTDPTRDVEPHIERIEHRRARARRTPEDRANPRRELIERERLDEIVIGARVESLDPRR